MDTKRREKGGSGGGEVMKEIMEWQLSVSSVETGKHDQKLVELFPTEF